MRENRLSELKIGVAARGILHHGAETPVSLEDWFAAIKDSDVFDYVDKTPSPEEYRKYMRLSEKYELPLLCGGWYPFETRRSVRNDAP